MSEFVLEARGISVQYPGTLALDQVTYSLRPGSISALIGENGAGKSTLVRVLSGITPPTSGHVYWEGAPVRLGGVQQANDLGIAMIHQELNLCPNLTIEENIFLGREKTRFGVIDHAPQRKLARQLLRRLNLAADPTSLVADLPLGQQQIVEIAKALAGDVRVLMMDEPTSALSPDEVQTLFRIMRELASGGVAIVYISHRLEELLEIADTVSVLRDGRLVAEAASSRVNVPWIVEKMTGRARQAERSAAPAEASEELLAVEGLTLFSPTGRPQLRGVSLKVHRGEIVGLYGLMGAGRTELLESIMGVRRAATGMITVQRRRVDLLTPAERIGEGLTMVPEDRKSSGLFAGHTVLSNLTISQIGQIARHGWLSPAAERVPGEEMRTRLSVKTPGLDAPIDALSGGNQQKVILGRCLLTGPKILLLDEPTRGVDVGAKEQLHEQIRQLAHEGAGVLVASSELDEIRALAHRVLVLSRGAVTGEFPIRGASPEALALAASASGKEVPA